MNCIKQSKNKIPFFSLNFSKPIKTLSQSGFFIIYLFKFLSVVFFMLYVFSVKASGSIEEQKINRIQVLGSHNSYRLETYAPIMTFWKQKKHLLSRIFVSRPLDYSHPDNFEIQFEKYGLRSLEIDLYHDPQGGRYYHRQGHLLIHESTESGIEELQKPGLKVMHFPDFDYGTHYYTFIQALETIKKWSLHNKNHVPIFIMIEAKEIHPIKYLRPKYCTKVLPFTKAAVDSIDLEIKSVFGDSLNQIFTPDQLRGSFKNLNEAVLNNNWPTMAQARGKIIFVLYSSEKVRENYLQNHEALKNRCMFVFSKPGNPETAFVKLENPNKQEKEIKKYVKLGYMVRTRSDANTKEARKGKYKRWNKAISSGAQIISTDYYHPDPRNASSKKWSDYYVALPDSLQLKE